MKNGISVNTALHFIWDPFLNFVLEMAGDSREYNGWGWCFKSRVGPLFILNLFFFTLFTLNFASDAIWGGGRSTPIMSYI